MNNDLGFPLYTNTTSLPDLNNYKLTKIGKEKGGLGSASISQKTESKHEKEGDRVGDLFRSGTVPLSGFTKPV